MTFEIELNPFSCFSVPLRSKPIMRDCGPLWSIPTLLKLCWYLIVVPSSPTEMFLLARFLRYCKKVSCGKLTSLLMNAFWIYLIIFVLQYTYLNCGRVDKSTGLLLRIDCSWTRRHIWSYSCLLHVSISSRLSWLWSCLMARVGLQCLLTALMLMQ